MYALRVEDIPEEIRTAERFQADQKVMVWCGISTKGKFPMVFIESGTKVNADYYRKNILECIVKAYGQQLFKNRKWTFQQDSAPSNKEKTNQQWCRDNLPEFISTDDWPPSSPDLNPLNYSIWGFLESRVNAKRHSSVESLKITLKKEWANLSMKYIRTTIDSWPDRLKDCIKNKGGRFINIRNDDWLIGTL